MNEDAQEAMLDAGSWAAIRWEIKHGDAWTILDELMHACDWLPVFTAARFRFCQWAHGRNTPNS